MKNSKEKSFDFVEIKNGKITSIGTSMKKIILFILSYKIKKIKIYFLKF